MPRQQVYSRRFIAAFVATNAQALAASYTVPVGQVAVVRTIDMFASTAGSVFCGPVVGGNTLPLLSSAGLGVFQTRNWRGDQVLEAGSVLRCQWVDGVVSVVASGFLFDVTP